MSSAPSVYLEKETHQPWGLHDVGRVGRAKYLDVVEANHASSLSLIGLTFRCKPPARPCPKNPTDIQQDTEHGGHTDKTIGFSL